MKLVGTDFNKITEYAQQLINDKELYSKMNNAVNPYGDGNAADRIVKATLYHFGMIEEKPEEFQYSK